VNPAALQHLATEEDVSDVLNLYHEYFEQDLEEEEEQPISDDLPEKQKLNDCGGDFGMEEEANMSPVSLAIALGYRTGRPLSFNSVRDRSGLTPWDDRDSFADLDLDALPDNLTKLRLHWHQLAGNHSIVRSILSTEPDLSRVLGILIADEVGLGKTAQAIAVIAFFMQAVYLQQEKRKLPTMLCKSVLTSLRY
jgi:SNF2 family DNA or RNA helicase